ncbi:MAG: ABC transporter ATP-binding protein [Candidatus Promineofilum sp.]|nr:ABC transporter ATP-binding protein [Promineifilum sp.]MCW5863232.1 ABC transporter ATP-binding protein [Anaerolineae bacterium]
MSQPIIETNDLSVYYGRQRGIHALNMTVEPGEVYGFLGPNGAGKTTTLRVLLDIIRPTAGRAAVFGLDCHRDGVAIRRRVGYIPGELMLYTQLRAEEYLDMVTRVGGGQSDPDYRRRLCALLDLDPRRPMHTYSRGNKQKVGLVAAFMRRPDLLILDEPTSGLDPLIQQNVLDLVREARADGRTVLFSSHVLPEVQAVCDRVGIIRDGQIVATEKVEQLLKSRLQRLHIRFAQMPPAGALDGDGVTELDRVGDSVTFEVRANLNRLLAQAVAYDVLELDNEQVTLEEIFMTYYSRNGGARHD